MTALVFSLLCVVLAVTGALAQQETTEPDDAVAVFNQAQDAHEKGDFKAAIELYRKALKIIPEFPEAEYQLGVAYLALDQTENAETAFRRAVELREDWSLPMASLGAVLVQKNEFPEAEKILTKAVEIDEMNSPAVVALTDLRLKTKAAPEVLKRLLTRLQLLTSKANPTASVWSARAAIERSLGDKTAAKNSLGRALAIEPNNKSALAERVELAFSENDLTGALEFAKNLNKITPESDDSKFLLARAYAENGNQAEALKILDSIGKPSADAAALRGQLTANATESAAELEKQLAANEKNAPVLGRLCALLRTENPAKALEYCRRAYEAEPSNLNYVVGFGAALVQAKQFENAVSIFRKITEIAPDNYTAHANLAISLFQLKRYPEAKIEYRWLAEKQPDLAVTYYFLGIIHDHLTEYIDAMANYQQFLKLADAGKNQLEIEKVNLRLPSLQKQIKEKKGKK
ncbi:MAG TPA: tetratricopeptide repeat protein [Pyrinomonadaceae bacterium]|jgi:tetratricopeptide (TPR) repeat protein